MDKQQLADRLRDTCLLKGEFILRSGRRSSYYFDKYLFETRPDLLRPVGEHLAEMLPPDTDRLAGAALGGVPLVTTVALQTGLPFVIVRKASKEYGTENRLEGEIHAGDRVVLVEDVATTAGAAISAVNALRAAAAGDVSVLLVLDRQEGAADAFEAEDIPYRSLFTSESLGIKDQT